MTREEYLERKGNLEKEFKELKVKLDREFALSNNTVKIGDIVADSSCIIKVEDMVVKIPFGSIIPTVYYIGTRLRRDFSPFKRKEKGYVYRVQKHIKQSKL